MVDQHGPLASSREAYIHPPIVCLYAPRDDAYEMRVPEQYKIVGYGVVSGRVSGGNGVYKVYTEAVNA